MTEPEEGLQKIPNLEDLAREAESNQNELSIQCRYGWALFAAGRSAEAQKVFINASLRWSDDIEVQYALGLIYKDLGDRSSAHESFQKAQSGQGDSIRQRMFQSMADVQMRNLDRST